MIQPIHNGTGDAMPGVWLCIAVCGFVALECLMYGLAWIVDRSIRALGDMIDWMRGLFWDRG